MSPDSPQHEATRILQSPNAPDSETAERLLSLVYEQLRKVAQQRMASERADHTIGATALVHEAYLRLVGDRVVPWQNRAHFFAAAAEAMRRILVDHAKARARIKRLGPAPWRRRVLLDVVELAATADSDGILSVDDAVCRLERQDEELGRIVRLRFYAGLSESEVAELLGVSNRTVRRSWTLARAWLRRELANADSR